VAPPISAPPPADEPGAAHTSPSAGYSSPSLERISARTAAPEPAWPEPRHATAQEPLRPERPPPAPIAESWAAREPIAVAPSPRALAPESPSLAAKLHRPVEPAHTPTPSHTSFGSHTSLSSHTSISSRAAHLDEREEAE